MLNMKNFLPTSGFLTSCNHFLDVSRNIPMDCYVSFSVTHVRCNVYCLLKYKVHCAQHTNIKDTSSVRASGGCLPDCAFAQQFDLTCIPVLIP